MPKYFVPPSKKTSKMSSKTVKKYVGGKRSKQSKKRRTWSKTF